MNVMATISLFENRPLHDLVGSPGIFDRSGAVGSTPHECCRTTNLGQFGLI